MNFPFARFFPLFCLFAAAADAQIRINSNSQLPGATVNQGYSFTLIGAAGTPPYSFASASGTLPPGITLSSAGVISGTPTAAGLYNFTVRITDSGSNTTTKPFSLDVAATPLSVQVSSPLVYVAQNKQAYISFSGVGGTAPYNYAILTPIPMGMEFTKSDCFCLPAGLIRGTAKSAGSYDVVVQVTDSRGRTATSLITLIVFSSPLSLSTFVPPGSVGAEYDVDLMAVGGGSPALFTLDATSGPLPPGLTLTSDGKLRGIPTVAGSYSLTFRATYLADTATDTAVLTINNPPILSIQTQSPLPTAVVGVSYSKQLIAAGPSGILSGGSWTFLTALGPPPPGMSLSPTGLLSGVPTATGTYTFTVQYALAGLGFAFKDFTITVSPTQFRWTVGSNLGTVTLGQYAELFGNASSVLTGGTVAGRVRLVSGAWPPGFGPVAGAPPLLLGTPVATGTYNFTAEVVATDGQVASQNFTVNVVTNPPLRIINTALPTAVVGAPYYFTDFPSACSCAANGGGHPYWWSVSSGSPPPGLTLLVDGELSGIPTSPGTYTFTLQVLDGFDVSVTRSFTLQVLPFSGTLSISTPSPLPSGQVGLPYSQQLSVSGGTSPFTFSGLSLPAGFTITPAGVLQSSGPLTQTGILTAMVQVTDSNPVRLGGPINAAKSFTFDVLPPSPSIISLNPSAAVAGSGPMTLTVFGANFSASEGGPASIVTWNGADLPTTYVSATQLTAQLSPALLATPADVTVRVRNPTGLLSNTATFTIVPAAPVLTRLSPDSVDAGSGAFMLTIEGTGFFPNMIAEWNGGALPTYFDSPTSLRASVHAGLLAAPAVASITVRTGLGGVSNALPFTIRGVAPVISGLEPASVPAGSPAFTLTVNGTGFELQSQVLWNNAVLATSFISTTRLSASVPANLAAQAGSASIQVRNANNQLSAPRDFFITGPAPTITSLTPSSAPAGSQAVTISIDGTNFLQGAVARFNGNDLSTTFTNATRLTATIPANLLAAPASAAITVRNPDNQISNPVSFNVFSGSAPQITSLLPGSVLAGSPGFQLSVNGSGFQSGAVVRWNNQDLPTAFQSATQLSAQVAATLITAPAVVSISVRNPDNSASAPVSFMVTSQPPPTLSGITPASIAAGSAAFTLAALGQNFQNGAVILFNGAPLTTAYLGPTQLTAQLSAVLIQAPGTALIQVRNPDGQLSATATLAILSRPPRILTLSPTSSAAGTQSLTLAISGTDFQPGAVVLFQNDPLPTTFVSATQLSALLVNATLLAIPGSRTVAVRNPDGSVSNTVFFQVVGIAPVITSIEPGTLPAGSPATLIRVSGANFSMNAQVYWNQSPLPTSFLNSGTLSASVGAELLAAPLSASIIVRNADGTVSNPFSFTVSGATPLSIQSAPQLPDADEGSPYQFQFRAGGGVTPYSWRLAPGSPPLPAALSLASDGNLTGTPQTAGAFSFTVEVSDTAGATARLQVRLTVRPRSLEITSTSPLPPATTGERYSYALQAAAGLEGLLWSIIEGELPPGLNLNENTGEIGGVPQELPEPEIATAGRAASIPITFQFRVELSAPGRTPVRKQFQLTVLPATGAFRITTASPLPDGVRSRFYSLSITAAGGRTPYRFTLSGQLPDGMRLLEIGVLEGAPAQDGVFRFSVRGQDAAGAAATQDYEWRVLASSEGPAITSGPLLDLTAAGQVLALQLTADGGTQPYRWAVVAGALPAGLTFDPSSGRISGQSRVTGLFRFTVRVVDAQGRTDVRVLTLPISSTGEPLQILTQALPEATLGRSYSVRLTARGGGSSYRWAVISGALPDGLRLVENEIAGIPQALGSAALTVQCVDAFGFTASRNYTLTVALAPLPAFRITGLPDSVPPGQQAPLGLETDQIYPVEIAGSLELSFYGGPGDIVDPALQFTGGGRTANFRIPAGQMQAQFAQPTLMLQSGTVAGLITVSATVRVSGAAITLPVPLTRQAQVPRQAPVITSAALERRAGGFELTILGFSSTREMVEAVIDYTAAAGRQVQNTSSTIPLAEVFRSWYANPASLEFGSQFRLVLPFTGDPAAIESVTLRLRNSVGESAPRRVTFSP